MYAGQKYLLCRCLYIGDYKTDSGRAGRRMGTLDDDCCCCLFDSRDYCLRSVLPLPALRKATANQGKRPEVLPPLQGEFEVRVIHLPPQVQLLLQQLNAAGFDAYAVGGCVRDSLLGLTPQDWDICTSAQPEQTASCFKADRTILTGARYGTVTVVRDGVCYEITTYRAESAYSDSRHPDCVQFLNDLHGDLLRRDFTINAMAADVHGEVTDLFGGADDLRRGILRCVGSPEARFEEDALRILRALRFASRFGFAVETKTAEAVHRCRERLHAVAKERLCKELTGLLVGRNAAAVLREFADVVCILIPELAPCIGFQQYNPHHAFDVWEHILAALDAAETEEQLRLAVLLHDIGKPDAFFLDQQLVGHFYGHAVIGAAMAETILRRLRFDRETVRVVTQLVRWHDCLFAETERGMRRLLTRLGEPLVRTLLRLRRADRLGKCTEPTEVVEASIHALEARVTHVMEGSNCLTLRELKISGRELLALGVPEGRQIGEILRRLFEAVVDGTLPNEPDALLNAARKIC